MKYNTKGLNILSTQLNDFIKQVGFDDNNIPLRLMLIISEISEAFEAYQKNNYYNKTEPDDTCNWKEWFEINCKDTFEDEIAGAIIRLLDLCGKLQIDIETQIEMKMKYNELRGFKYGGKKF